MISKYLKFFQNHFKIFLVNMLYYRNIRHPVRCVFISMQKIYFEFCCWQITQVLWENIISFDKWCKFFWVISCFLDLYWPLVLIIVLLPTIPLTNSFWYIKIIAVRTYRRTNYRNNVFSWRGLDVHMTFYNGAIWLASRVSDTVLTTHYDIEASLTLISLKR